jgi:hypothetical protein
MVVKEKGREKVKEVIAASTRRRGAAESGIGCVEGGISGSRGIREVGHWHGVKSTCRQ